MDVEGDVNDGGNGTRRKWFADEYFDLIVWFGEPGRPDGFQLCYDRAGNERAFTWSEDQGYYTQDRIDEGEASPTKNQSPILVADGSFHAAEVLGRFESRSADLDPQKVGFAARLKK